MGIEILTPYIVVVVVALIGVTSTFLCVVLKKLSNNITKNIQNSSVKTIINSIADSATCVVKELNQTIVNDLKEKAEDGKLSGDDIIEIKTLAIEKLNGLISDESKAILSNVVGDFTNYLSTVIEAKVDDVKNGK